MARVIVADDDLLVRQLLRDLLSREGFDVGICADGLDALRRAELEEPALWVLDLEMPKASGIELIRGLRARRVLTPVLLLSGAEDHPAIPAALAHSGVELLLKPFRIGEFRRAVARALGRSRKS